MTVTLNIDVDDFPGKVFDIIKSNDAFYSKEGLALKCINNLLKNKRYDFNNVDLTEAIMELIEKNKVIICKHETPQNEFDSITFSAIKSKTEKKIPNLGETDKFSVGEDEKEKQRKRLAQLTEVDDMPEEEVTEKRKRKWWLLWLY